MLKLDPLARARMPGHGPGAYLWCSNGQGAAWAIEGTAAPLADANAAWACGVAL